MSIFDWEPEMPNIEMDTMGGKVFWENLKSVGGYVLQKNIFSNHCRILDANDRRVAWGSEGSMRVKLRELMKDSYPTHAEYGDVIGVHRIGGAYDHYGVYESDDCVYHFAAEKGDFGDPIIHTTSLERFVADSNSYFVLEFPTNYGKPGKVEIPSASANFVGGTVGDSGSFLDLLRTSSYRLFSPSETIERAQSKLGKKEYNLLFNNCEHYAIWCKTGIAESHQVEGIIEGLFQLTLEKVIPICGNTL